MELEELKTLWQKIDHKLDNLGKINKKMIFESVTKDRQKKLNRERYQYLFGLIIGPLGVTFILFMRSANFDWKILLGIILSGFWMSYSIFMCIRTIIALRSIDLNNDSILDSAKKFNLFKLKSNAWSKFSIRFWPLSYFGMTLVFWDLFVFDFRTISILIITFVVMPLLILRDIKVKQNRYAEIESDILELNEYL